MTVTNKKMTTIAKIFETNNGKKKIKFFHLGIYKLLKEEFGFRYIKINGKGHYLKSNNGVYEIVSFFELKDKFTEYLKAEFDNLEYSIIMDFETFINEYYRQNPIKNGNFARDYLSDEFEPTEYNFLYNK